MKPQKREVSRFLNSLWPSGLPDGSWLTSAWKNASGQFYQRSWNNLDHAAIAISQRAFQSDTYISCGVPSFEPERNRRARADEVHFVPGFWLDIDFGTNGHSGKTYPPTVAQAYHLLAAAPEPTLVVESGHGLQTWWLFPEAYEITNGATRERFISTFASLHSRIALAADSHGWSIDSTHDLARVLRPAGTLNFKAPGEIKPVVLTVDDGPKWSLTDIEKALSSNGPQKLVEPSSRVFEEKVTPETKGIDWTALSASTVAKSLLAGEPLNYPSASERDAALAKIAVINGATEEQTQSLIYTRRVAAGEDPAKTFRPSYLQKTYEFVQKDGGELPTQPDDRLLRWLQDVLPKLVLSERQSVQQVLVHMVQSARGRSFLGTRGDIAKELDCDSKTVSNAWKRMGELGIIKPINPNPSEGIAKGAVFLLPNLTKQPEE